MTSGECPVLQLRLLVQTDDYDAAVRFYRDELGLPEQAAFAGAGEARVAILDAGRATLELANPAQRRLIDDAEVGHPSGPRIRVALEVADTIEMTERLVAAGAALVSSPRQTPWRSLNARLDAGRAPTDAVPGARTPRRAHWAAGLRHRCTTGAGG